MNLSFPSLLSLLNWEVNAEGCQLSFTVHCHEGPPAKSYMAGLRQHESCLTAQLVLGWTREQSIETELRESFYSLHWLSSGKG